MSEYIYTNLPKVVKTNTEADFSNSVIKEGSVLLFSEDGATLKAKLPDGSFLTVGSGGGEDDAFVPRFGMVVLKEGIDGSLETDVQYMEFDGTETVLGDNPSGIPHFYIPDMVDTYTEPEYEGSSGGSTATCEYYRCTFVNTSAKTWMGYKAVQMNGIYKFESTVTTGLQYTTVFPVVGNVYSADALVLVKELYNGIPTSNLLCYIPLTEQLEKAPTGQSLQYDMNTISYSTVDDIPCGYFANSRIQTQETYTWNEVTLSGFMKPDANVNSVSGCIHIGRDSGNQMLKFGANENTWFVSTYGGNGGLDIYGEADITDRMHHIAVTLDSNKYLIVYLDGTKVWEGQSTVNIPNSNIIIGNDSAAQFMYYGYIAVPRVYTRALTADEIQALATEFTPTDR